MSVVQRCPSCGTTRAAPGECEACHEAQVRSFCTNHEPGIWLDGPTCPACEARAAEEVRGVARRRAEEERAAAARRAEDARLAAARHAEEARDAAAWPDRSVSGDTEGRAGRGRELASPAYDDEARALRAARKALWGRLLGTAALARTAPRREPAADGEMAPLGQLGGCLMRVVLIGLFLIAALIAALWVFGRAVL